MTIPTPIRASHSTAVRSASHVPVDAVAHRRLSARSPGLLRAALVAGLVWLAASPVLAQDASARAAEAFARGQAAVAEYDYAGALESFEEAQRIAPHDAVRFNIAVCLEYLGRYREAWLQYVGAAESTQLDDAARADARESAERLRARLGTIVVTAPAGARVLVDGEERCSAPCETETDPGEREVRAVGEGGEGVGRVTVGRGERHEVAIALLPPVTPTTAEAHGPGWLLVLGSTVAALGVGGIVGFGLRAEDLHASYTAMPPPASRAVYDEGVLMQTLANASIVVASIGAALAVLDLVLTAAGSGTELASLDPTIRF